MKSNCVDVKGCDDDVKDNVSTIKIVRKAGEGAHVYVPRSWIGKPVRVIQLEITPRSFLESLLGKQITDALVGKQEATGNQPWKPFEPDPKPDLPIPNPDYDDEEETTGNDKGHSETT